MIGCGIAQTLATRGATVTLLDPRSMGDGASRASAGMLAPFSEGRHDLALHLLGARSLARYDGFVEALADQGLRIPYARAGSIDVACDEAGAAALDVASSELTRDRVGCQILDHAALHTLEPAVSADAVAGLVIPAHGAVDVPALVAALWHSAVAHGARLERASASRISRGHPAIRVETNKGILNASRVVLAAGCWVGQVAIEDTSPLPVRPVRGQLLVLRTASPVIRHIVWGPDCYLVPWSDGTVLVGATVEDAGFDERSTASGVQQLLRAATTLVPQLAEAAFVEVRVGLRPGTSDGRPIVGLSQQVDGLIYATGHYRNGALLAPLTCDAVADLVNGTSLDPIWAPCAPQRFGHN